MTKEWLWWISEFGLVVVVAVVAGFVTKDVPISILYGLFVGTVFFVLREHRRVVAQQERQVSEMENKALNLPPTFTHLETVDPHMRRLIEKERSELLRLAKEIAEGEISLRSRPAWQIVNDFHKLAKPGDRIIATNAGGTWGIPLWDLVVQTDCELANSGVDFTRIFIEPTNATPDYKKHLKQEMDRHKEGHIKVRFIKESRLPPEIQQNGILIADRYCGYMVKGRASELEHIVWQKVFDVLSDPQVVLGGLKAIQKDDANSLKQELAEMDKRLKALDDEQYSLLDQSLRGFPPEMIEHENEKINNSRNELAKRKAELETRIQSAKQVEADMGNIKRACEIVKGNLTELNFETKRKALEALNIKVWIDNRAVTIEGYIPMVDSSIVSTSSC